MLNMRFFLLLILICQLRPLHGQKSKSKANVLFILVDDLGWRDLGYMGSDFYETPNIDQLAKDGVVFTNAYSASPVCSPTRAAIMTGKHPVTVNITDWIPGMPYDRVENRKLTPPEDIHDLPLEEVTIAELLKNQGYRTFYAGKWHLGETAAFWPEHQGFEINKGGNHMGQPPGGYYSPYKNPRLEDGPEGEYLTDRLTDETIHFMETTPRNAPFLAYLAYYTVHTPIQGCDRYDEEFQDKANALPYQGNRVTRAEREAQTRLNQSDPKYAAMVKALDENIGRLITKLKALNLYDNTIIVFTSDNGGLSTTRDGGPTSVTPLRAGKGWCYEGGIRIPLIIRAPGYPQGKISNTPSISMDHLPTLLELAAIPQPKNLKLDGESLGAALKNPEKTVERSLVWHYPHYHGSTWRPGAAIREGNWKLVEFFEEDKVELFNLENDPGESQDLAAVEPGKADQLQEQLHEYIKQRGGNFPEKVQ
jgi:arylsulfatase A-like enzyme